MKRRMPPRWRMRTWHSGGCTPSSIPAGAAGVALEGAGGRPDVSRLPRQVPVNTVDLNSGAQALWGLPGLDDVRVADAVFASCALPGMAAQADPWTLLRGRRRGGEPAAPRGGHGGTGPIVAVNLNPLGPFDLTDRAELQAFAANISGGWRW